VQRNYTNREIVLDRLLGKLEAKNNFVFSLDDRDIVLTRIAALLHDAAHIPFGHVLEKEGNLIKLTQWADKRRLEYFFEDCRMEQIIKNFLKEKGFQDNECHEFVEELKSILRAIEGADPKNGEPINAESPEDVAIGKLDHPYIGDIVGNTLCADLFDYVLRDAYFTGLKLSTELRIINNFAIIGNSKKDARLTLLLVRKKLLREDTLSDAVQFLRERYFLAERVYYHKVKAAASAMLMRAIYEYYHKCLNKRLDDEEVLKELMEMGDDALVNKLLEDSRKKIHEICNKYIKMAKTLRLEQIKLNERIKKDKDKKIRSILKNFFYNQFSKEYKMTENWNENEKQWASIFSLLSKFKRRELHKPIYMVYIRRESPDEEELNAIIEKYVKPDERHKFERYLEELLLLPPGSVIVYVTKREVGKAANARCLWFDGSIRTLEELDQKRYGSVGEFPLLRKKYESLWKLYVFLSKDFVSKDRSKKSEVEEYAVGFCKEYLYSKNHLEYERETPQKNEAEIFIDYVAPKLYPNIQHALKQRKLFLENVNRMMNRDSKFSDFVSIQDLKKELEKLIPQSDSTSGLKEDKSYEKKIFS
jgi:HD superfamily phosphohydrolase